MVPQSPPDHLTELLKKGVRLSTCRPPTPLGRKRTTDSWQELRVELASTGPWWNLHMGVLTAYLAEFLLPTSDNFVLSLDLSDNRLTDHSVEELMDWLASCEERVMVATLKLYKNQLTDRATQRLGRFVELQHAFSLRELHLSHNQLSRAGIVELLKGFLRASVTSASGERIFLYPMKIKERYVPTWLRLEHNLGQWEPAEIFDEIQSTLKEVRPSFVGAPGTSATPCQAFCFATHKTQKDVKCSPTRCKFSAKTPDQTPLFHLYALRKQKTKSHGTPDGSPVTKKVSVKGSAKEMPATSVDVKKTGTSRAPRRPIDQSDRILREHTRQDGAQEAPPRGLSPFNSPRSPKMTYVFADPSALLDMFFFDNLGLPGRPSIVTMGVWNRLVSEGIFADSPGERVMFICDESSLMVAFSMARREGRGMLLDVLEREHIPSLVKSGLFQIVPLVAGWASAAPIPQTLSPDISHCLDPYYFAAVWAGNLGKLAPHVYFLTSSGAFLSTYKHYAAPLGHCTMPDFKSVRPVHTSVLNTVLQRHLPEKIVQFAERSTSITTDDIKGVFTSAGLNNALLTAANETWCVFPSVTTSHASQVHSTLARSIDTLSRTVTEYALDPEVFEHVRTVLDDLLDLTVHQSPVNRRAYSCVDAIDMSPHSLGSLMSPVFPDRYSPSI